MLACLTPSNHKDLVLIEKLSLTLKIIHTFDSMNTSKNKLRSLDIALPVRRRRFFL